MSLEIKNLTCKNILTSVDLIAKKGEMSVVIGPNGAGKSTLIRSIAGILKPKKAAITLDGVDLSTLTTKEIARKVSYLAQMDSVANMCVLDLLEIGRRAKSGAFLTAEDRKAIDQAVERFNLEKLLFKNLANISGGERQRSHIASVLLEECEVMLLDEPIAWLDPKNQIEILQTIKTATKSQNLITIVVLHDLTHTLNFADRVVMIKDGKKLYDTANPTAQMLSDLYEIEISIAEQNGKKLLNYG